MYGMYHVRQTICKDIILNRTGPASTVNGNQKLQIIKFNIYFLIVPFYLLYVIKKNNQIPNV